MSKIVLIDGHSILNRAFFGLPDLTNAEGLHTNAIYGFLNIMFKILEEEKPEYLTVAFDVHAPTFRHKMFEAYKGTRKPMAEELRQQVPLMKKVLHAMVRDWRLTIFLEHCPDDVKKKEWKCPLFPETEIFSSLLQTMLRSGFRRQNGPELRSRIIMQWT